MNLWSDKLKYAAFSMGGSDSDSGGDFGFGGDRTI